MAQTLFDACFDCFRERALNRRLARSLVVMSLAVVFRVSAENTFIVQVNSQFVLAHNTVG